MRRRHLALSASVLPVLLLCGCVPFSVQAPADVPPTSSARTPDASDAPAPVPAPTPGEVEEGGPEGAAAPTVSPVPIPSQWSLDELVGACKEAWIASGEIVDWSQFDPDATIEENVSGYAVTFENQAAGQAKACNVSGTPSEPDVELNH